MAQTHTKIQAMISVTAIYLNSFVSCGLTNLL